MPMEWVVGVWIVVTLGWCLASSSGKDWEIARWLFMMVMILIGLMKLDYIMLMLEQMKTP